MYTHSPHTSYHSIPFTVTVLFQEYEIEFQEKEIEFQEIEIEFQGTETELQ